jgi:DNA replication protein DnaC
LTYDKYDTKIASTCAARAICGAHNSLCAPTCVGYNELETQIRLSNIPRRYLNIGDEPASVEAAARLIRGDNPQIAAFIEKWGADILAHIESGRGLYLWGRTTGNGKTTVAASISLDWIRRGVSVALANRESVRNILALFVHVPSFLRQAKQIYESDEIVSREASAEVADLTRRMTKVPLLVLDDIGAEKPSEAVRERLLTIIDARWADSRSTIYTSNLALNELEISLGARIRSRIEGTAVAIQFGGSDRRRRGAA